MENDPRPEVLAGVPLLQAMLARRSRRFARGMTLDGGPLSYSSRKTPQPLTVDEEAALAFAGCGITGYALAELPYRPGREPESGGGNIMSHFVGRTVASGDAMHDCTLFVTNDAGTWLLKRPQDYSRDEIPGLLSAARDQRLIELYDRARVKIADQRVEVPRQLPFVPPFNKWTANVAGTTYFLPVAELTALYINMLLSMFDDEFAYFVVDDHNGYQPAGITAFARSAGGHLHDDFAAGRVLTLSLLDTWVCEFVAIEQGAMLQNLGLMAAALDLGGFPHFAAHPFIWPLSLGFRTEQTPLAKAFGLPVEALGGLSLPTPVGLERDGEPLLKPFCPPYYADMQAAVLDFVAEKYAAGRGVFRDGGAATGWHDPTAVQREIPPYPDRTVDATIACCRYIYDRYGRFPASTGPFRTVLAYQAHRLDPDFYRRFYKAEAWTGGGPMTVQSDAASGVDLMATDVAADASAPAEMGPARFPVRTWLIAFVGWMFDFYDLVLITYLLTPIKQEFDLTEGQEAVLIGTALGASGIGGIIFGYFSDVYGRKRVLMWTIVLYSLGTALTAAAVGPATLMLFRIITGLGIGGEWAVGHALVAESCPKHIRGRGSALLQAGEPCGVALAAVMGLLVAPHIGWRAVFLISSASALVAVVARYQLPESPMWKREAGERSAIAALKLIGEHRLWGALVKGLLLGVFKLGTYWTCYIWLPKFLQNQMGQRLDRTTLWILTAQLGQFLGMMGFGIVADRFGRRWAFTVYSLLTATALYPLAFDWQELLARPLWFWADLFALGLGSGCTAGFGALLAELFPTEVRNFAMGITYNTARGVQFFAPIVVGFFVAKYGLAGGLCVPLVLAMATACWVWTLPETRTRDLARVAAEPD